MRALSLLLCLAPVVATAQWNVVGGAPFPAVPGAGSPARAEPAVLNGSLYVISWDIPNSKSTVQWSALDAGAFVRLGVHDAGSNVTAFQTEVAGGELLVSFNEFGCVPSVFGVNGASSSELGAGFSSACVSLPVFDFEGAPHAFDPATGALLRWNGASWTAASSRIDPLTVTAADGMAMSGEVYVAFNVRLPDAGSELRVSRFDGGSWEGLGDGGLNTFGPATGTTIAGEAGRVFVSFVEPSNGVTSKSLGYLKTWTGTNWASYGGDLALGGGGDILEAEVVMVDGQPFVGVRQSSSLYVVHEVNGAWAKVFGTDVSSSNKLDSGPRLAFDGRALFVVEREGPTGPLYVRSGTVSDGGSLIDAGTDGGAIVDGGSGDGGSDAGEAADGGGSVDGGAFDGGALSDGGIVGDGGSPAEAIAADGGRAESDAGEDPQERLNLPVGCDCTSAPGGWVLAFALIVVSARRRCHSALPTRPTASHPES